MAWVSCMLVFAGFSTWNDLRTHLAFQLTRAVCHREKISVYGQALVQVRCRRRGNVGFFLFFFLHVRRTPLALSSFISMRSRQLTPTRSGLCVFMNSVAGLSGCSTLRQKGVHRGVNLAFYAQSTGRETSLYEVSSSGTCGVKVCTTAGWSIRDGVGVSVSILSIRNLWRCV